MSGLDKDRYRNRTIAFRVSAEESAIIEERIVLSGLTKSEYYLKATQGHEINIVVGKYQSDRLSLEFRRLREQIEQINISDTDRMYGVLMECKVLLRELKPLIENKKSEALRKEDFENK